LQAERKNVTGPLQGQQTRLGKTVKKKTKNVESYLTRTKVTNKKIEAAKIPYAYDGVPKEKTGASKASLLKPRPENVGNDRRRLTDLETRRRSPKSLRGGPGNRLCRDTLRRGGKED